jgi:hypothetical protein
MNTPNQPNSLDVLTDYRLSAIEKNQELMSENLKEIGEAMRMLISLEQKHVETREALERAFKSLEQHNDRIHKIEIEMPTVKLTRGWVMAGVLFLCGIFGIQMVKIITGH